MPFGTGGAEGVGIKPAGEVFAANLLEGGGLPDLSERGFADVAEGLQALVILIAKGHAAVGENEAAGSQSAAGESLRWPHVHDAAVLQLARVMAVPCNAHGADPPQPTIKKFIEFVYVFFGLDHFWNHDGSRRVSFPLQFRKHFEASQNVCQAVLR